MKKFLFTLAALLMAGTAMAGRIYIPDTEFTKDQLGTQVWLPVYVELNNEYMNGWDISLEFPEKLTVTASIKKNAAVLTQTAVTDEFGSTESVSFTVNGNAYHTAGFCAQGGYWDPDGDGEYELYGAVKIGPTGNFMLYEVRVQPDADFTGGDIKLYWMYSGGTDKRNGQGPMQSSDTNDHDDHGMTTTYAHLTVEQDQAAPEPKITMDDNYVVTAAVENDDPEAPHTVELYLVTTDDQGNETRTKVNNPYSITQTFDDQTFTFVAVTIANDGESENTECDPVNVFVPGKDDNQCPQPEFAYYAEVNEVWARVMYYGDAPYTEYVKLYLQDEDGNWVEVDNPYTGLPTENNTFDDLKFYFKAITLADGENYNINSEEEFFTVTIPGKADNQAPKPTFRVDGDKLYAEQGDLTVELYKKNVDGTWTKVDNPYEGLPTENTSYTDPIKIEFKAITLADGETYNLNSDEAFYNYELAPLDKKTAQKPTIEGKNLTNDTKDIVITPDPNTDGLLAYNANPEGAVVRAAAVTLRYERKDVDYYVNVTAYTMEGATYKESELAEDRILIPAKEAPKVYEVADPTISVAYDDAKQQVVITIDYTEGQISYNVTDEEGQLPDGATADATNPGKVVITIPYGEETQFVDVNATTTLTEVPEGYDSVEPGFAEKLDIEIPYYQQTATPTIDVSFGGEEGAHYANVTFVNNDDAPAVIEYSLDGGETWNTYNPNVPVVVRDYGEVTVLARAKAEGKAMSEQAERTFTLNDDATSVSELVNGKTVAGVRYFNMAGQEMQEANGITIVVTTYTDGTTSAVKVMK